MSTALERRRWLRQHPTPAEACLWTHLRNRRHLGLKFRRQHPIGPFIVDFYCDAYRLVVEVDGDIHSEEGHRDHDRSRTSFLTQRGYRVLRFRNADVLQGIEHVLRAIAERTSP